MQKKIFLHLCWFFLVIFLGSFARAEIYQWTDEKGEVHFSDKNHEGAQAVTLQPIQTYQPGAAPPSDEKEKKTESPLKHVYKFVQIDQPLNNSTVRNNQGTVMVSLSLDPPLMKGDKVVVILDGQPMGAPQASATITLTNVERGSHSLSVQMIDAKNQEIGRGKEITFHMHRPTVQPRD